MGRARYINVVGIHDRLAHAQRVEQCQLLAVGQEQFAEPDQDLLAFHRRHPRPRPLLERPARRTHGEVHFVLAACSNRCQQLVGRRIDHLESRTRGARNLLPSDQRIFNECLAGSPLLPVVEIEHTLLPCRPLIRSVFIGFAGSCSTLAARKNSKNMLGPQEKAR
ncbi:hypothetical protein D3C79_813180 [compost metagenome]